ncbi:hypothetical protein TNCV_816241 [Trichonephila clavipes]|nr:hypothetical protein TNCV_816241 [Trichonephila clavipes]
MVLKKVMCLRGESCGVVEHYLSAVATSRDGMGLFTVDPLFMSRPIDMGRQMRFTSINTVWSGTRKLGETRKKPHVFTSTV